jgi:hypothetical protein
LDKDNDIEKEIKMTKLSSIFYPFATPSQIDSIKIASIYFDDVYLLTPISLVQKSEFKQRYQELVDKPKDYPDNLLLRSGGNTPLTETAIDVILNLQKEASPLIEAGIIKVVNPFDEIRDVGLDNEFRSIMEYRADQAEKREKEDRQLTSQRGAIAVARHVHHCSSQSRGLFKVEEQTLKSIMYDAAILVSKKFDAIPVTGSDKFGTEFKFQMMKHEQLPMSKLIKFSAGRVRSGYDIMSEAILANVPYFENISFKDILNLRQHCESELQAFRIETRKLATDITFKNSDVEKGKEILDIVSKEITPIICELERKIKLSRKKWAKRLIDKSTSVETLASLVSTLFAGLPLHYGLLIAAGVAGVQASLETYFDTEDVQASSGLAFLIRLRKKQ